MGSVTRSVKSSFLYPHEALRSDPQAPLQPSPIPPRWWVLTWACSVTGACSPPAAGKGLVEAAHFCYLMAHVPFGSYTVKTDHLALLGSSHRYVIFWGKGSGKDIFQVIRLALGRTSWLHFPLSCVNFGHCWSPPLGWFSAQVGSGGGDAGWVPHHTARGPQVQALLRGSCELVPVGCIVPLWPLGGALAP